MLGNKRRNESKDKNHQHLSMLGVGDHTEAVIEAINKGIIRL